jgi:hypothetical protein
MSDVAFVELQKCLLDEFVLFSKLCVCFSLKAKMGHDE